MQFVTRTLVTILFAGLAAFSARCHAGSASIALPSVSSSISPSNAQSVSIPKAQVAAGKPAVPSQGTVAILPLLNLSERREGAQGVAAAFADKFRKRGFTVYPENALRGLIRKYRLRSVGGISAAGAEALRRDGGIDYIAIGAIDVYADGRIPEVGVTLRLLDAGTAKVVWAASAAQSGQDGVWAFGLGRIGDPGKLTERVVDKLFRSMPACVSAACRAATATGYSAVIIPFDNQSEESRAGDIVTALMLPKLASMKLEVIEPGVVEELLATRKTMPRGEIDLETMAELKDRFGVDFVVTGSVDDFSPGRGDEKTSNPQVEMTVRYLWTGSRSVAGLMSGQTAGQQSEWIFGVGRQYSFANLITDQLGKLLDLQPFTRISRIARIAKTEVPKP